MRKTDDNQRLNVKDGEPISIWNCLPLFILLLFMLMLGVSCTSTKEVVKTSVQVDSTAIKELSDSVRILRIENDKLTEEKEELQYGIVRFDTVYVPGDTVINTVTITKEGEIRATGKISAAYVSKSVLTKIVNEKQLIIDSLRLVKQKEIVKVVTNTVTKEVHKKRTFLSQWWIWFIIGLATGCIATFKMMEWAEQGKNLSEHSS